MASELGNLLKQKVMKTDRSGSAEALKETCDEDASKSCYPSMEHRKLSFVLDLKSYIRHLLASKDFVGIHMFN